MNQLQAVFNKEPPSCKDQEQMDKWKQKGPLIIGEFATKFGLNIDTSKAIDAEG